MKSEFEARPVFVRREDRIRAHFLTCHISLLVYRLLEKKLGKEYPIVTGDMDETVIITYSPKYKAYQQKIREGQIQRAMKMMQSPGKSRKGKNPNDPARFIQKTSAS